MIDTLIDRVLDPKFLVKVLVFGLAALTLITIRTDVRNDELVDQVETLRACLGPVEGRPIVLDGEVDPCARVVDLEKRVDSLSWRSKGLFMDCSDLSESCVRMTAIIDDALREFIRTHVDPAEIERARDGIERYARRRGPPEGGVGGEED